MFGTQELLIILAIVVVLFGAKKLPQLGAAVGKGVNNFKKELHSDDDVTAAETVDQQEMPDGE